MVVQTFWSKFLEYFRPLADINLVVRETFPRLMHLGQSNCLMSVGGSSAAYSTKVVNIYLFNFQNVYHFEKVTSHPPKNRKVGVHDFLSKIAKMAILIFLIFFGNNFSIFWNNYPGGGELGW